MNSGVEVLHLYISPGHNYLGHHGKAAGQHAIIEAFEIQCVAGCGIRGDRFFNHQENYKGQITFFDEAVYGQLCERFGVWDKSPSVLRRNVITRGLNLNGLIGRKFEIQNLWFEGVEECRPCYWMDTAFHPGAEAALKGCGGLRARILTSGSLRVSRGSWTAPHFRSQSALAE